MITTRVYRKQKDNTAEAAFRKFFKFEGYDIPADQIAAYMSSVLIAQVRKRFLTQTNPDGSKWPMTKAAKTRLSGGYTYAKGGPFAPGGMKTGGNILFSSGNLFHSIQLVRVGKGSYSIRTDVPYAHHYMNDKWTIIGTTGKEIDSISEVIMSRLV